MTTFDRDAAERFLSALDPGTPKFTFQTFDDNQDRKDASLARVLHGTINQHWLTLGNLNDRGAGVFITINQTDLKGRRVNNIVRVRACFVDLDGAPFPGSPHRPPHIVNETSPGRWHLYWLVSDLPLDEFCPTQKRLIQHYKADKAVHDLPRVMRIPGFYHRKNQPFLSKLLDATDLPPYTIEELLSGLRPQEEPRQSANGQDRPQDQSDRWRRLNSDALANLDLWVPRLFPKAKNSNQGYRVSSRDLGRDLQEDISFTRDGIVDFGIHDMGDGNEGRRTPIDIVMEWNSSAFKPAVTWLFRALGQDPLAFQHRVRRKKPNGHDERPNSPDAGVSREDFYAYMPMHQYIFGPTREVWPAVSVDSRIPPVPLVDADGNPLVDDKGEPRTIKASAWLDKHRPVEQMTWVPGEPEVIIDRLVSEGGWLHRHGFRCFNLYRPPPIIRGNAGKASLWIEHVHRVYAEQSTHIIRWLAHRVQKPQEKINHALVLGGNQGIGKDTILEPVKTAVGPWNFVEVSPQQLLGRFNGFLKSVILRVSEARDLGDVDRYAFYDHMKAYTAAPPDVLRVDEKNLREYSLFNVCGVVITTNHKTDGLFLPSDDRRHHVAWSGLSKEDFDQDYWNRLWGWYARGGTEHVAAYLAALDILDFDPKAPPPKTAAWRDIVDANRAPEEAELADVLDAMGNPDATTLMAITTRATGDFATFLGERKNRRAIPHRLDKCGYVAVRNEAAEDGLWKIESRRQVIYAKASLSEAGRQRAARNIILGQ
jgi:hypothetical protein